MIKKVLSLAIIVGLSVSLTACGKKAASNDVDATSAPTKSTSESEATVAPTEEVSKKDTADTQTNESEERVVASSVAVVEILDALGVPVVGVPSTSYTLPESAKDATVIGSAMSPDLEIIASLEPTAVISVDSLESTLGSEFEKLNLPASFVNLSSLDGLKETITVLGERFGAEEKAKELLAGYDAVEADVAKAVEEHENPSVLIIFGASGSFMVANETSYVGDLVKRAGGINIISKDGASFSPVDMEYLAQQNPDYILFMAHANPEESLEAFKKEFETNAAWDYFDAVKNDKVIALETSYFGMSANLLADQSLQKLVTLFYGE